MPFATASPNEYLVVGDNGTVVNRGSGIRVFLWPGSTSVLIPSTKQEALFEMTQETRDGIPLRFKGIVIYRVIDPVVSSMSFNFTAGTGVREINALINNICLGELRAVVSGMTMQECIEQRKTALTAAVDGALRTIVNDGEGASSTKWGIDLELVQVAQVFIVDAVLRKQLEAQVRNEILSKSEQSDIHTQEEIGLVQMASDRQIREQKLITEKTAIRQKEEIELAQIASDRQIREHKLETEKLAIQQKQQIELAQLAADRLVREQKLVTEKAAIQQKEQLELAQVTSDRLMREEKLVTEKDVIRQKEEVEQANLLVRRRAQKQRQEAEKEAILLAAETFKLEQEAEKEKAETEAPVKLLQVDNQLEVFNHELEMRKVECQIRELEASRDMLLEKARHELRKEILPIEQVPAIANSLSNVFQDAKLSFVGSENQLLSSILPLMQMISEIVKEGIAPNGKTAK